MTTTTATKRSTGVPEGFVEHTRKLSDHGRRVREAHANGELRKRSRTRARLSAVDAQNEANAITSALTN
ncbi:hypothetical protein AB6D53_23335 [Vibrio splendidus]